jgi:hypothetical protein
MAEQQSSSPARRERERNGGWTDAELAAEVAAKARQARER